MAEGGDSAECKRLGRQIHPFVEEKWVAAREAIIRRGVRLKFDQHDHLWQVLKWWRSRTWS